MRSLLRGAMLSLCLIATAWPTRCEAYVRRYQFPLSGHGAYAAGRGQVSFAERFVESGYSDGATLIVEVTNVPLPAGTELLVYFDDKELGTLTLNTARDGRLVLESTAQKAVPRLSAKSLITLRLPAGGPIVIW